MNKRCLAKRLMALSTCLALVLAPGLSRGQNAFGSTAPPDSTALLSGEQADEGDGLDENKTILDQDSGEESAPGEENAGENGQEADSEEPPDIPDEATAQGDTQPEPGEVEPEEAEPQPDTLAGKAEPGDTLGVLAFASLQLENILIEYVAEEEGILPLATEISATEIEVSTYDELVAALGNGNRYTEIYFANDITAPSNTSAVIGNQKTNITIYGRAYDDPDAENIFTLRQYASSSSDQVIRVLDSATQSVTVRDMNVYGENYYGVIGVAIAAPGVTTRYENVTYTGPQMCYNRTGTVELVNCDISIVARSSPAEEVAEGHSITLGGTITVNSNVSGNGNSAFWITDSGTSPPQAFTLLPDAKVTVNSTSYLWYADYSTAATPATVTLGVNSTLTANTATGVARHFMNYVFEENASASFIQSATGDQTIRVLNSFTMLPDSNLDYRRTGGTTAIAMIQNMAGAQITFDDPGRVYLYNYQSTTPILFGGAANNITFKVDAMNIWSRANDADGTPTHIWNRANGNGKLVVDVRFTDATTYTASSNLDLADDPVNSSIDAATLALRNSNLLVFGRILLDFDLVTDDSTSITGNADPGAQLTGGYEGADGTGTLGGTADENGQYDLAISAGAPVIGSTVALTSFADNLRMRQNTTVQNAADFTLSFLRVPATLPFQTIIIPDEPTYVQRQNPGWTIVVQDNRPVSTGFSVQASIAAPLTASYGGAALTMEDALVYVEGASASPLSTVPLKVYSNSEGASGEYNISWAATQGPLVYAVPGNLQAGVSYTTTILWDLVDAP